MRLYHTTFADPRQVCNYHIYGNLGGAYADNVGTPLGNPTITGSYTG